MRLPLPKPMTKKRKSNATTVAIDKDGWIDTNATKRKRKSATSVSNSSKKATGTTTNTKKATTKRTNISKRVKPTNTTKSRPKKDLKRKENEVIELIEDSDESDSNNLELVTHTIKARPRRVSAALAAIRLKDQNDLSDDEYASENEFE